MTDPLGQSQVIPYLVGLSEKGHEIFLISCEKKTFASDEYIVVKKYLHDNNIRWYPLKYTLRPPVLSAMYDLIKIKQTSGHIIKRSAIDIIHCRSYIAALAGLAMKKKYGVKFIFDMRGYWADERVEGGVWNLKNPVFKSVYNYFKKKEKQFCTNADYIICLTENAKAAIRKWDLPNQPLPVEVIPCCANLDFFDRRAVRENEQKQWQEKLNIKKPDFIISYLGSLGTWYMLPEMLDFFRMLLKKKPEAKFLFITPDKPDVIMDIAEKKNIPLNKIIVQRALRSEVPALLSLSHISVFFIKPVFSKTASSPTKMGEIMGMGIPLICNSNVGDINIMMKDADGGILVNSFDDNEYERVVNKIDDILRASPHAIRRSAEKYYSLGDGVNKYDDVYRRI